MNISTKSIIFGALGLFLLGLSLGRYSVQSPTTKTTEQTQTDINKQVNRDTHTDTTITVTEDPSGKKQTVTTISQDTTTRSKVDETINDSRSTTITPTKRSTLNISALASADIKNFIPVYGLSVTKEVLGPITVGGFGLSNGVIGISVGLDF